MGATPSENLHTVRRSNDDARLVYNRSSLGPPRRVRCTIRPERVCPRLHVSTQPCPSILVQYCQYSMSCLVLSDSHKRRLRRRGFGSGRRKHVEE